MEKEECPKCGQQAEVRDTELGRMCDWCYRDEMGEDEEEEL